MNFDFLNRGAMLAPMAGVTDMPFRVLCHEMGCPMAVSEMVSAKGYLLAPKDNRATRELLSVDERERGAVALQLFGHEPEIMARAEIFGNAARARALLRQGTMGLLACYNEAMWSTYVDPYDVFMKVGPEFHFLSVAELTEAIDNVTASGQVKLGAMEWTARSTTGENIPQGTLIRVDRIEGVKVYVTPVNVPEKI